MSNNSYLHACVHARMLHDYVHNNDILDEEPLSDFGGTDMIRHVLVKQLLALMRKNVGVLTEFD